jgi:hypothetical protein
MSTSSSPGATGAPGRASRDEPMMLLAIVLGLLAWALLALIAWAIFLAVGA